MWIQAVAPAPDSWDGIICLFQRPSGKAETKNSIREMTRRPIPSLRLMPIPPPASEPWTSTFSTPKVLHWYINYGTTIYPVASHSPKLIQFFFSPKLPLCPIQLPLKRGLVPDDTVYKGSSKHQKRREKATILWCTFLHQYLDFLIITIQPDPFQKCSGLVFFMCLLLH